MTTSALINKIDEITINAKTTNWKAIEMLIVLQETNKRTIPFDPLVGQKIVIKCASYLSPSNIMITTS